MTPEGDKLTAYYQNARVRNRNKALDFIAKGLRQIDANNIRGEKAELFIAEATAQVYEARKQDEFLATMYTELMTLFETGQAHPDFEINDDFLIAIGFKEG